MMNNQVFRVLLLVPLILLACGTFASAESSEILLLQESVKEQLDALGLAELTRYIERIEPDYQEFLPEMNWQGIFRPGRLKFSFSDLLKKLLQSLFKEVLLSSHLMRQLLVIALLSAFFNRLQLSLESTSMINVAFAVCFLIVIFVGLQSFHAVCTIARNSIDEMVSFMYALLPVLSTLLAAVGGVTSAAIFHPVLIMVVSGVAFLISTVLFPMLNVSAIIGLLSNFAQDFPLARLDGLIKHLCTMLLSLVFTVFIGVVTVRGALAPIADGVGLRAAKFLTGTIVPVIGSMFANAVEVVIGGSLLIKNTIGVFGLLIIFFFAALPILKIWAVVLIYKVVGALIEPICDKRISEAISGLAGSLTLIMVSLATVALMFFLAITILVGFGNLTAAMR